MWLGPRPGNLELIFVLQPGNIADVTLPDVFAPMRKTKREKAKDEGSQPSFRPSPLRASSFAWLEGERRVAKTPAEVLDLIQTQGVQIVDYRFIDLPGVWQHFSVPAEEVDEGSFEEGLGF